MRLLACIVIVAACSFDDPKLDATRFRCDGGKPCPSGQVCAGTICVSATHDGIACGPPGGLRCTRDEQCCIDNTNPPRCIPGNERCIGTNAPCDGAEDCPAGLRCCGVGVDYTCAAECSQFICQEPGDCPTNAPNCCEDTFNMVPWKVCEFECTTAR